MKIIWIIVAIIIIILVLSGFYYIFSSLSDSPSPSPVTSASSPVPSVLTSQALPLPSPSAKHQEVPQDWQAYVSKEHDFNIRIPADIKPETTPEGDRFIKLGPTQSTGTELYDGIAITIKKGILEENKTLDQLAKIKYEQAKSEPTTNSITELQPVIYGPLSGYQFRKSSLGEADYIYFQKSRTEFIEVINNTVEPANSEQTLGATARLMISSLEF